MELFIICVFAVILLACILTDVGLIEALLIGYGLFFYYSWRKGFSVREILGFSWNGISTIKNILYTFLLIGVITAVWRSCGTIAFIVHYALPLCNPAIMLLADFLLCAMISTLIGTSFGSAGTMGIICMSLSTSMGIDPLYAGGAILSGVYFGDRSSPLSTSALLVSTITDTEMHKNLKNMFSSAWIPFFITCIVYFLLGWGNATSSGSSDMSNILSESYDLSWPMVIPALLVVLLSLKKIEVRITLFISIICGMALAVIYQDVTIAELGQQIVWGFHPENEALARVMSGGGILSMMLVFGVVMISSSYAGIFQGTGFFEPLKKIRSYLERKLSYFGSMMAISMITGAVACNQVLSSVLTHQFFIDKDTAARENKADGIQKSAEAAEMQKTLGMPAADRPEDKKYRLALDLENSVIVMTPLIPWSIAGGAPLSAAGAEIASIPFAFYLVILPFYYLFIGRKKSLATSKE